VVEAQNMFFDLFNAYLGLGLIVGIAALGIITLRAVHERRQQVGMLRALGFTRAMARRVFLMEAAFISMMGILIGVLLGISVGWQMWYYEFKPEGMDVFTIPYLDILTIVGIALVATIICTVPPAHQAAKVTPSEALRYE
jgi:putative ABC transport system permease protein